MDVDGINPGMDFRKAIDDNVSSCGVLLAMIGPTWSAIKNSDGERRLVLEREPALHAGGSWIHASGGAMRTRMPRMSTRSNIGGRTTGTSRRSSTLV